MDIVCRANEVGTIAVPSWVVAYQSEREEERAFYDRLAERRERFAKTRWIRALELMIENNQEAVMILVSMLTGATITALILI